MTAMEEFRVRWGPGGPPQVSEEWAELAAAVNARLVADTARRFDELYPNTTVPACLAGPATLRAGGDPPCPECGWEVGHAWTCSRAG